MRDDLSDPPTLLGDVGGVPVQQKKIFDPAVLHFRNGFRLGPPELPDEAARARWIEAKRAVGSATVRTLAQSIIGESLVLRGSWLMSLWFGDRARDPHDLDFLTLPPAAPSLTQSMIDVIRDSSDLADLGVRGDEIRTSEIWTYERAEGRRLAVPWAAEDDVVGVLQIDVTFDETMDEPPTMLALDPSTNLRTATIGQSLIWKLEWLLTDMHPQGKDLFDAHLLDQASALTAGQWRHVVARVGAHEGRRPDIDVIDVPETEWRWFCEEHPELASSVTLPMLRQRVVDAIRSASS